MRTDLETQGAAGWIIVMIQAAVCWALCMYESYICLHYLLPEYTLCLFYKWVNWGQVSEGTGRARIQNQVSLWQCLVEPWQDSRSTELLTTKEEGLREGPQVNVRVVLPLKWRKLEFSASEMDTGIIPLNHIWNCPEIRHPEQKLINEHWLWSELFVWRSRAYVLVFNYTSNTQKYLHGERVK